MQHISPDERYSLSSFQFYTMAIPDSEIFCTMRHHRNHELFTYWNALRGNRLAPRRLEIEPGCIGPLLPDIFLLERHTRASFPFRLAGARIADLLGKDVHGKNFLNGWSQRDTNILISRLNSISIQGGAALFLVEMENILEEVLLAELLILPLLNLEVYADRYLGCLSPFERPNWLGQEPLIKKRLQSDLIISPQTCLPSSRPTSLVNIEPPKGEIPIRKSRLVIKKDRQFRVYDGGRIDPKPQPILTPL